MRDRRLSLTAMLLSILACVLAGAAWGSARRASTTVHETAPSRREEISPAEDATPSDSPGWLTGTPEKRFAQLERQLRGLDLAMAEIGYRYRELHFAAGERNWDYGKYQAEKIDLALRLALERRPKRASSAQSFLNEDLPAVLRAIESHDAGRWEEAMIRLHDSCVACHRSENVLYFRSAVERLRAEADR